MNHAKDPPVEPPRRPEQGGPPASAGRLAATARSPRRLESADLFAGDDEILIQHRGREYRLRITQNGKLILNA